MDPTKLSGKLWNLYRSMEGTVQSIRNIISYCEYKEKNSQDAEPGGFDYPLHVANELEASVKEIRNEIWESSQEAEALEIKSAAGTIRPKQSILEEIEAIQETADLDHPEFTPDEESAPETDLQPKAKERPELFLGGYIRPFSWKITYAGAVFEDRNGEAFVLKGDGDNRVSESIHGILLDKLLSIINGERENTDDFPKLTAETDTNGLRINGLNVSLVSRTGPEGKVDENLRDYFYMTFFDEDENRLCKEVKRIGIEDADVNEMVFRYNTGQFPIYNYENHDRGYERGNLYGEYKIGTLLYEAKEKHCKMLALEAAMAKKPADEYDQEKVNGVCDAFYALDPDSQAYEETILKTAAELNALAGKESEANNKTTGEKLGVYYAGKSMFFTTVKEWNEWKKKNLLVEGDILVPGTDWSAGRYLLEEFNQLEKIETATFKFATADGLYNEKIKYVYGETKYTLSHFYTDNKEALDAAANGKVVIPLPYTETKKNREQLIFWLSVNLFLLGLDMQKTKINDFLKTYSYYRKNADKKDKGFRKAISKTFAKMIKENDHRLIDNSISGYPSPLPEIPKSIIDGIIDVLP